MLMWMDLRALETCLKPVIQNWRAHIVQIMYIAVFNFVEWVFSYTFFFVLVIRFDIECRRSA